MLTLAHACYIVRVRQLSTNQSKMLEETRRFQLQKIVLETTGSSLHS